MTTSLQEFMEGISHREFLTWREWKKDQWNNPNRSDYYLMQIAGCVAHVMSKKSWNIKDYKIPITIGKPTRQTIAQQTAIAKATWEARANALNRDR